jgi:hypothetical protein
LLEPGLCLPSWTGKWCTGYNAGYLLTTAMETIK